ncbi:MAG: hypothetical protein OXN94_16740 [Chloroflexota bacterium]|nr:hypothetical protein [Chloroflexota bacterium]MDE2950966.1 hypothetical protein [Chloroflexota bacterium]
MAMKTRSTVKNVSLLVALIFLFAALPSQAQDTSDLSIDNLHFAVEYGIWHLIWESEGVPDAIQVQFASPGITDVWTSVNATLGVISNVTPQILLATFNPLVDNSAGLSFEFRIRVAACSLVRRTYQCAWTSGGDSTWAYTAVIFASD